MHPNPAYRQESQAGALDFARERGFGALTVANSGAGPILFHSTPAERRMVAGSRSTLAHQSSSTWFLWGNFSGCQK